MRSAFYVNCSLSALADLYINHHQCVCVCVLWQPYGCRCHCCTAMASALVQPPRPACAHKTLDFAQMCCAVVLCVRQHCVCVFVLCRDASVAHNRCMHAAQTMHTVWLAGCSWLVGSRRWWMPSMVMPTLPSTTTMMTRESCSRVRQGSWRKHFHMHSTKLSYVCVCVCVDVASVCLFIGRRRRHSKR